MTKEAPHYHGHRNRIREKFLKSAKGTFTELDLLEMVLFWSIPRRDVKPLAKELIHNFGSLGGVVSAHYEKLKNIKGITEHTYINIMLLKETIDRILQGNSMNKNVLGSWSALMDYLKVSMGELKTEEFRILFMNKKNILIADELQSHGTVDQAPVYPREVVKRSLFYEASAIILVHNHPSGNNTPSKADIMLTKQIAAACKTVNITVHDHVIVSLNDVYSFKSNMIL